MFRKLCIRESKAFQNMKYCVDLKKDFGLCSPLPPPSKGRYEGHGISSFGSPAKSHDNQAPPTPTPYTRLSIHSRLVHFHYNHTPMKPSLPSPDFIIRCQFFSINNLSPTNSAFLHISCPKNNNFCHRIFCSTY